MHINGLFLFAFTFDSLGSESLGKVLDFIKLYASEPQEWYSSRALPFIGFLFDYYLPVQRVR